MKFLNKLLTPGCIVGLSAMLTTTMINMSAIVERLKKDAPGLKVIIGGAPVNHDFCEQINADFYSPDPQGRFYFIFI